MKKALIFIVLAFIFSGCSLMVKTYVKGEPTRDDGYLTTWKYDVSIIPEFD